MSEIRPVRLGVLSTARIAREKVIPGFRTTPLIEVAAIASRSEQSARQAADALGIPLAFGSYEALLADPSIEAVYIPTPNDSHVDLSLAAARAGKHVLCEKPAALDAADADRLRAIPSSIVYMEAFMVRHHPQWIAVRDMVRAGRIGTPLAIQGWFSYFNDDPANIRNRRETGGGAMMDIGCYPVVVSRFVLDAEPVRLVSQVERDPAFGTDRLTGALVDFGGGRHLTFTVGTQCVPHQRMTIAGTAGRLEVMIPFNAPQGGPTFIRFDDGRLHGDASSELIEIAAADQYGRQGAAFAEAIRAGGGPAGENPGVADAIAMMRIIDAVFASETQGGWVSLAN